MENVEARLAALELAITELRAQLDHERTRIRTMRLTHRCPACGGKHLLHFRRIDEAGGRGLVPLALDNKFSAWWGISEGEPLQLFGCRKCGLLEWYAPTINRVKPDGEAIVEIVGEEPSLPSSEPYR